MRSRSNYRRNNFKIIIVLGIIIAIVLTSTILLSAPKSSRLAYCTMSSSDAWSAVVIFNEANIELPDNERIIFNVPNNSAVKAEDVIGEYYKKGYITSAFETYSELRQRIVSHQNDVLLKDIYQPELNQYAIEIDMVLTELQTFNSDDSDYIVLNQKLKMLMESRQAYIRENHPADEFLQRLYQEEEERLIALNDWMQPIKSAGNGYVSWYVNSDFNHINTATAASLGVSELKSLLNNSSIYKNVNNSTDFSVRIISDGFVYLAVNMKRDVQVGQSFIMYTDVGGQQMNCNVISVKSEGGDKCVILRAECSVANFLEHRIVNISETPFCSGYRIENEYILNDGTGNYLLKENLSGEKEQIFVEIISQNERYALLKESKNGEFTQDTKVFNK